MTLKYKPGKTFDIILRGKKLKALIRSWNRNNEYFVQIGCCDRQWMTEQQLDEAIQEYEILLKRNN